MKKALFLFTFAGLIAYYQISAQPLTGIKTIKPGGDFTDFGSAITALNTNGAGQGGVVFKVPAGTDFTGANFLITATGTAESPISFVKEGSGNNPVITGRGVSASITDFFFKIYGGDYITFDGIDLATDPALTDDLLKMEYGFYITNGSATDGSKNVTIKNCKITLELSSANRQVGIFTKYDTNPASEDGSNSDFSFENISINKGKDGIYVQGNGTYPAIRINISGCKIGSPSEKMMTSYTTSLGYGIGVLYGANLTVSGNEIQNVVTSDTYYGIYSSSISGSNRISNNKIHNLFSTKTDPESDVMGIYYSGVQTSMADIFNNLVYDLDDSQSVEGNPLYFHVTGIMLSGQVNCYYNTICLKVQNPKTLVVGLWPSGNTSVVRNNIIADYSVPAVNNSRVLVILSNNPTFENNLLYIDESIPGNYALDINSTFYKFPDFQKGTTKPSPGYYLNNIFADPNFTGPENFIPENPSAASGNGVPYPGITGSFNGITRSLTHPDIGAYEGDFGISEDHYLPQIRFIPIASNSDDVIKLFARITDNEEVKSAKLWYRKAGSTVEFSGVDGTKYGETWEFKFSPSVSGNYEYFICASDAGENVISNGFMTSGLDAAKTGLTVNNPAANTDYVYKFGYKKASLSGDVTIGMDGADYTSLTGTGGLFDAINNTVVSGNINAIITGDVLETGAFDLKQWAETGQGGYRLTIKPHNATMHTLVTVTAGKGINFTGSDRVTIDGSYNNDGLAHIKIDNPGFNPLRFYSDANNGSEGITIKYCILSAGPDASGIYVNGTNHKDFVIEHVTIGKAGAGVLLNYVTNAVVSNCSFGSTDINNSVNYYGVKCNYSTNVVVEKNSITNIAHAINAPSGIYFYSVTGGRCDKNIIKVVKYSGTAPYGGVGINLYNSRQMTVSNNVISGMQGLGSSNSLTNYNSGINAYGCSELKLYFNSINLYGITNTYPGAISAAIIFMNNTKCELINNVFSNRIENSVSSSKSFALYYYSFYDKSNVFRNNLYFLSGTGSNQKYLIYGYNIYNSNLSDLKSWQGIEKILSDGVDLGSGDGDPNFNSYSSDDLTLSSISPALGSGIPVSVTDDVRGSTRSTSKPTIGAYEYGSPLQADVCGPVISIIPIENSASTSFTWSATITDNSNVVFAELQLRIKGSTDNFNKIQGVLQNDNRTWSFNISGLTAGTEYEYFVSAMDAAGNWMMNGISPYLSTSQNPFFVRYFKVTGTSISIGNIPEPFYISSTKQATFQLPFTTTGTFSGNEFIALMSNNQGSFTNRTEIGRVISNSSGTIAVTIPQAIPTGSGYRIIIESTNPVVSSIQSPSFSIINDNTAPAVTLSSSSFPVTGIPIKVGIAFAEKVTGFTSGNIKVTNATVSEFSGSGLNYMATITPQFDGKVAILVPAAEVTDLSGNLNGQSNLLEFLFISKDAPRADVAATNLNRYFKTSSQNIKVSFDQDISGFEKADVVISNGTINDFNPDGTYPSRIFTFNIYPAAEGELLVQIPGGSATNGVYPNSPASSTFIYDITKPVITLSIMGTPDETTGKFPVMAVIDSKTKGFALNDLNLLNCTADNFTSISSAVYSFDVTPLAYGPVTVEAAEGSAADDAGNSNAVSNRINYSYMTSSTGENIFSHLRVYPNPTSGTFQIELPGNESCDIEIIDIHGKVFLRRTGSEYISVDLAGYPKGMYLVRTTLNNMSHIARVIYQ